MAPPSVLVARAYAECERITRAEARNFSYGIRLLPPAKRGALSAVYAFARRMDDIGDEDAPLEQKSAGLAAARKDLANLAGYLDVHDDMDIHSTEWGGPDRGDPVLLALADTARRFPLPVEALAELVDGVDMDLCGTTYETFDDLVGYCRRVAGTIGRLSVGIFCAPGTGAENGPGPATFTLADTLGVALQQTNILRDVREDLLLGRVYLPAEDLDRFGVTLVLDDDGVLGGPRDALDDLLRFTAARAELWYSQGLELLDVLDRRSAACCGAMAGIYLRLNRRIGADPTPVRSRRVSLPGWEKAVVAARNLAGRPDTALGRAA